MVDKPPINIEFKLDHAGHGRRVDGNLIQRRRRLRLAATDNAFQ